jgi:hypothetical protein
MFVDESGALWLSDPAMVGLILAASVALVVWCHRWLETGSAPMPRVTLLRNQNRVMRTRALRTRGVATASVVVPLSRFTKDADSAARARLAAGRPRSAA